MAYNLENYFIYYGTVPREKYSNASTCTRCSPRVFLLDVFPRCLGRIRRPGVWFGKNLALVNTTRSSSFLFSLTRAEDFISSWNGIE